MKKRLQRRLDKALLKIGLVRMSRTPRLEYDFQTKEVFIQFGDDWRNRVHGYVCPTPDGSLKKTGYDDLLIHAFER